MSITKKIFPNLIQPSYNDVITVVSSDNTNQDSFLFIFDIKDADGTRIARRRLPANPKNYGIFNAQKLIETQTSIDIFPTLTGITQAYNSFFGYTIEVGEQFEYVWNFTNNYFAGDVGFTSDTRHYFSAGDSILVTQNVTGATNTSYDGVHTVVSVPDIYSIVTDIPWGTSTGAEAGTITYSDFRPTSFTGLTSTTTSYVWNGAVSHEDFRTFDYTNYIISSANTGSFMTNVPSSWKFDLDSRAYVLAHQTGGTQAYYIRYDLSDGTTYRIASATADTKNMAIGVGTWNLNNSGFGTIIDSSITSYSAYTENSSSARTSSILTFDVYDRCAGSPYTQFQIAFMDRLGSVMSMNFDLASKKSVSISRDEYKKITGSYDATSNTYGYNSYDRGRTVFNVDVTDRYTINSDYVPESFVPYLEELFSSSEAYHIDSNGNWLPIIISNTTFDYKYRNTDKLIQYSLDFEYANRNRINA